MGDQITNQTLPRLPSYLSYLDSSSRTIITMYDNVVGILNVAIAHDLNVDGFNISENKDKTNIQQQLVEMMKENGINTTTTAGERFCPSPSTMSLLNLLQWIESFAYKVESMPVTLPNGDSTYRILGWGEAATSTTAAAAADYDSSSNDDDDDDYDY